MAAMLDPKKLRELLETAVGPLAAFGALVGAVAAGVKWLTPVLADSIGLGPAFAQSLAICLPLLAASVLLWGAYRGIVKKSSLRRMERFDLRVRKPEDLLGREADVANLKSLIDDASLLLVDGESGSGKSSVVAFGLLPKLREDASSVPIFVVDYAGDWDTGFATRIFDAAWSILSAEERTKVGFSQRPAIGTVRANSVREILEGIGTHLGRMPILILDQFDDYQLSAREQFLGPRMDWITPSDLVRRNRAWAVINDLLHGGKARLLVVTRSDASAGLHSVRLADHIASFTVNRLNLEWLSQWLDQITADDGKGDVIAYPDAGWTDLKRHLARDMAPQGSSVSVLLPQQVRIIFLGLRKLPSLTLTDYRRAASGSGVEALYIRDAIASAASESGLSEIDVRAVLSTFVDRAEAGSLKTKVLSLADVAPIVGDAQKVQRALDRLERDEVVREKPALGDGGSRWQLDHDYIARAVVAEYRAANILSVRLRDGNDAWRMAGGDIRQRYRSLLTLTVQAKLAWARVQPRQGFTYGPYRAYAAMSTLRALPFVLTVVGAGWLWHDQTLRAEVTQIVDELNQDPQKGGRAAVALWGASAAARTRVLDRLLSSPGRLRDAGTDWVKSFTSIEPAAAKYLTSRLISRLDDKDLDPDTRQSLAYVLRGVGGRLDAPAAAEAVKDLRARLDKDLDPDTRLSLAYALGDVGGRLDAPAAAEAAKDLRARLDKDLDPDTRRSLIDALGGVGGRLDAPAAAEAAKDLVARFDKDLDPDTRLDRCGGIVICHPQPASDEPRDRQHASRDG
jgi:Novel STAND NTPase 1